MATTEEQFNSHFSIPGKDKLPEDVLGELQSIGRMHSMSSQDVFYKWESYCLKMGSEDTKLNIDSVRALKKDIQEVLERETKGKSHMRGSERKIAHATPRGATGGDDVLAM
jgi:DNA polymerase alpha subunit B